MEIIFEVNKYDTVTIDEIYAFGCPIKDSYSLNGLNGTEIVALVVAFIPAIKDLILALWPKETVSIKISNEFGSAELTANNIQNLSKLVDQYIKLIEEKKITKTNSENGN